MRPTRAYLQGAKRIQAIKNTTIKDLKPPAKAANKRVQAIISGLNTEDKGN